MGLSTPSGDEHRIVGGVGSEGLDLTPIIKTDDSEVQIRRRANLGQILGVGLKVEPAEGSSTRIRIYQVGYPRRSTDSR